MTLKAPFPYFGGKRTIAAEVWKRLGVVDHYIEPFFGSGATLLASPYVPKRETVNDLDCLLVNVWRGIRACPDKVAEYLRLPVSEVDQNARHLALMARKSGLQQALLADPECCDPQLAAYWIYGKCCWMGSGFCSGKGRYRQENGDLVLSEGSSEGVNFQMPTIMAQGNGILNLAFNERRDWICRLSSRLEKTRMVCGDWSRLVKPSVLVESAIAGILFDPPYFDGCQTDVYANNSTTPALEVQAWCLENGDRSNLRIVLCGYEGEHNVLEEAGWSVFSWKANGGFGNQGQDRGRENAARERLWFSPHCVSDSPSVLDIFGV